MQRLRLYHVNIELHGVLLFSSRVYPAGGRARGVAEETAPIIHNYPLIYAFNGVPVESYGVVPCLHYASYGAMKTPAGGRLEYPLVEEAVRCLAAPGLEPRCPIYAYPAAPLRLSSVKLFFSARTDSYGEYRGKLKTVFPRTVTHIGFGPGSQFEAFIVSAEPLPSVVYSRLGMKRLGSFRAVLEEARVVGRVGDGYSSHPVNIGDVETWGARLLDRVVLFETRSPPYRGGKPCPSCARVGYVRGEMYIVEWSDHVMKRRRRALLPLPPGAWEAPPRRRVEPAW